MIGDFYTIDINRNFTIEKYVDAEAMARETGVLKAWEAVRDE